VKGQKEMTRDEVKARWPRLVAHMIAESLGYFTPNSAANALLCYCLRKPFWCEWYHWRAERRKGGEWPTDDEVLAEGVLVLQAAIQQRHHHKGYMAHYPTALALVRRSVAKEGDPLFASWF